MIGLDGRPRTWPISYTHLVYVHKGFVRSDLFNILFFLNPFFSFLAEPDLTSFSRRRSQGMGGKKEFSAQLTHPTVSL